jgi:hypothetical protein
MTSANSGMLFASIAVTRLVLTAILPDATE